MNKSSSAQQKIVGPWKVSGPSDWREKYRPAVEFQCAGNLMLKCAACGWIHIASSKPEAAGKTVCFWCGQDYTGFVRAQATRVDRPPA